MGLEMSFTDRRQRSESTERGTNILLGNYIASPSSFFMSDLYLNST